MLSYEADTQLSDSTDEIQIEVSKTKGYLKLIGPYSYDILADVNKQEEY